MGILDTLKNITTRQTPQSEKILGSTQTPNSAGGWVWPVDDTVRLDRFLILGSEGGSYYSSERTLSLENAEAVVRAIDADGPAVVRRVVEISEAGRAPKNDPAIFVLALAASVGDAATRRAAFEALPRVCRTGTHLLHFAQFVEGFRGWGRGLRRAVAAWYTQPADRLAYQAIKYGSRDGWSQRDLLRLSHPKGVTEQHAAILHWIARGWEWVGAEPHPDPVLRRIWAVERVRRAETVEEVVGLVREHRLPREAVPTQWLGQAAVWEALLETDMPTTALIRNLATLTRVGLLVPGSDATRRVVRHLRDAERLRTARVHPIAVLAALKTYASGRGARGQGTWDAVPQIVDALDGAFYTTFENVEPTGKRWLLALDVSGSMGGGTVAGVPGLTPRIATAAMALVTAAREHDYEVVAFSAPSGGGYGGAFGGGDSGITSVPLSPRQRLDDVLALTDTIPMGGTDCSLPMRWALKEKRKVDVFVVYTDNETWYGDIHPAQALRQYREQTGIPAKLVVVSMIANPFSIADPADAGMLDVVGFDTATPAIMADFARGQ
ncbi:MAG: TROVE domain-containing protein [Chloroflexi bacterium]|nr:TROVE domain-containing protein [Chloroflexota bacterium]